MFSNKEERNYFWLGHAQFLQGINVLLVFLMLICSLFSSPGTKERYNPKPVDYTTMKNLFASWVYGVYFSKNTLKLATAPYLRQLLYHNLQPCEPNFQEDHNISECDVEAKQYTEAYQHYLTDTEDPFANWDRELCGWKPFDPNKNRFTMGQVFLRSQQCTGCLLPIKGYVLNLPFLPPVTTFKFIEKCVMEPFEIWFRSHVRNDTFAIVFDAIYSNNNNLTMRVELMYERLLTVNLWWKSYRYDLLTRIHFAEHIITVLSLIIVIYQITVFAMECYGGGHFKSTFGRFAKLMLHLTLISLAAGVFLFYAVTNPRWRHLMKVLNVGPPLKYIANNDKEFYMYVMWMYQHYTNYHTFSRFIVAPEFILLLLQLVNFIACTTGYLYGICLALRRLIPPILRATCWAGILGLLAYSFHGKGIMETLHGAYEAILVTRDLDIECDKDPSTHLLILLHVTMFFLLPLLVGFVFANLNVARELRRGKGRWWVKSQKEKLDLT